MPGAWANRSREFSPYRSPAIDHYNFSSLSRTFSHLRYRAGPCATAAATRVVTNSIKSAFCKVHSHCEFFTPSGFSQSGTAYPAGFASRQLHAALLRKKGLHDCATNIQWQKMQRLERRGWFSATTAEHRAASCAVRRDGDLPADGPHGQTSSRGLWQRGDVAQMKIASGLEPHPRSTREAAALPALHVIHTESWCSTSPTGQPQCGGGVRTRFAISGCRSPETAATCNGAWPWQAAMLKHAAVPCRWVDRLLAGTNLRCVCHGVATHGRR